jgi:hypothetical protein
MIYGYITGRLGNQLFYYAIARTLDIKLGGQEKLIFSFRGTLQSHKSESDGYEDSLKYFRVKKYDYANEKRLVDLVKEHGTFRQKISYYFFILICRLCKNKNSNFFKKMTAKIAKEGLYIAQPFAEKLLEEYSLIESKNKNLFIGGPFEKSSLFNEIKRVLQEEFTPKMPPLESNRALYEIISSTNSICISIRRGDYESDPETKKYFSVCDKNYFLKAQEIMIEKVKNPIFVIFSDDIEWCKNNIHFQGETYFESGTDPVWEKLRLMYSCKHFIISNSTFSWWAQYLSRNKDKIVISPSRWFVEKNWPLIEEDFIKA